MAQGLKLLAVLWLAAACLSTAGASAEGAKDPTTTSSPTTPAKDPTTTSSPTTPAKDPTTTSSPTTPAKDPTTTSSPTTPAKDPTTTSSPTTPAKDPTTTSSPTTPAKDPTTTSSPTTPAKDPTTTSSPTTPAKDPTTTSSPTTPAKDPTTTSSPTTPAKDPTTTSSPTTPAKDPTTTSSPKTAAKDPTTTSSPKTPAKDPTTTFSPTTPATDPMTTTEELSTSQQQPTTPTPDPCAEGQCGEGSTCVPRADQTFECLCLAGDYYNNNTNNCVNAKVFPGHLLLPGMQYKTQMNNPMSTEFPNAYRTIKSELDNVFKGVLGYENMTLVELRPLTKPKVWTLQEVNATIQIIFSASSDISTKEIEKTIEVAANCDNCLLANAKFDETKLCDKNPCDTETTTCLSGDGSYNCTCREAYYQTDFSSRLCIACPSGQKVQGSKCVDCPYGYSGLNCSESWQLALVIIGSVFGGLLLITLTLLPIVAYKSSKKSSKKSKSANTGNPDTSHFSDKAPLVNGSFAKSQAAPVNGSANGLAAFANAGVPRIPRATANGSWDSRTNLEMTSSNSRQNLVPAGRNARLYEDDDMNSYAEVLSQRSFYTESRPQSNVYAESRPQSSLHAKSRPQSSLYAESRPQSSLHAQVRPQNNPYAQRPQINPYASSQGHTNPYYTNDNGRQFNY